MHLAEIIAGTLAESEEEADMKPEHDPQAVLNELLSEVRAEPAAGFSVIPPLPELPSRRPPRAGESVTIGYPHQDSFGANFVESVLRMIARDKVRGNHLMHDSGLQRTGAIASVWGRGVELEHARNVAVAAFLSSDSEWLLWIDTDMGFEPDALEKLMAVADPETAPVVGGLCFILTDYGHDWRGGLTYAVQPTLYDWAWLEGNGGPPAYKLLARTEWPRNEAVRVGATGCGFLLTHRSVYERISAWCRQQRIPDNIWFQRIPGPDGELCGEDVSFCLRVHQMDIPIMVHTGVITNHQKTAWISTPHYRQTPFTPPAVSARRLEPTEWPKIMANRKAAEQAAEDSPIRARTVAPATETVDILVPVAARDNAARFLESLRTSLTAVQQQRVQVHVLADESDADTVAAWLARRNLYPGPVRIHVDRYPTDMGTFAQKINVGFARTDSPWVFVVGDDVFFHHGWLDQAMHTARETGKSVIGTNDMGNPTVAEGRHATHFFLRREYVLHSGGGWDGPGVVAHEGYRHWYVDNEIIAAAKERGEWAPCLDALVEHMHPYWDRARMDDVYRIGEAHSDRDRELYEQRAEQHEIDVAEAELYAALREAGKWGPLPAPGPGEPCA